jgi:hypothetical protein
MWFIHVDWLDWRMGGPGNGHYVLYLRAIDPAGNRDERFVLGRNMHKWRYISPTPWDIIFGCIAGFIFCAFMAYAEYRRRVKKAAMERYAMKRMRRKFKAMQRDTDGRAVDWRTLYSEHKELKEDDADRKKRAREMKKKREKAKEQREKDKQKRDREKDKIRKKLKDKDKKKNAENTGGAVLNAITDGDNKGTKSIQDSENAGAVVTKSLDKKDGGSTAAGLINRGKSNRFKDYEIDDPTKKKDKFGSDMPMIKEIDNGDSKADMSGSLKKGKSNMFKTYEIDEKGGSKTKELDSSGDLKRGKSTMFKTYEIEDKGGSKTKDEKATGASLSKGKSSMFKSYEIEEGKEPKKKV